MRATISHHKTKTEVVDAVNRSMNGLFNGLAVGPIEFTDQVNQWTGDRMFFSLNAKMGPVKAPIKGFVDVKDTEVTIDVDLGILGKFISDEKLRHEVEGRVKGLLA
jgi:hypothetical protein